MARRRAVARLPPVTADPEIDREQTEVRQPRDETHPVRDLSDGMVAGRLRLRLPDRPPLRARTVRLPDGRHHRRADDRAEHDRRRERDRRPDHRGLPFARGIADAGATTTLLPDSIPASSRAISSGNGIVTMIPDTGSATDSTLPGTACPCSPGTGELVTFAWPPWIVS